VSAEEVIIEVRGSGNGGAYPVENTSDTLIATTERLMDFLGLDIMVSFQFESQGRRSKSKAVRARLRRVLALSGNDSTVARRQMSRVFMSKQVIGR
jgi:hypothetical protein